MAGTIQAQLYVDINNGGFVDRIQESGSYTQTNVGGGNPGTISVGTVEETVTLSELTTPGTVIIKNLDATNYVDFGFSTGVYGIRLKPGRFNFFDLAPGVTLYAKANTAACRVSVQAYEV